MSSDFENNDNDNDNNDNNDDDDSADIEIWRPGKGEKRSSGSWVAGAGDSAAVNLGLGCINQ